MATPQSDRSDQCLDAGRIGDQIRVNPGRERGDVSTVNAKSHGTMPSHASPTLSPFDRFADLVGRMTSRAAFFVFCLVLVLLWAPSYFLFQSIDTWQLIINTVTTIVTFLLVALLQNTQKRSDDAVQQKLNAIASGLANVMEHIGGGERKLEDRRRELLQAVGLEDREGS